MAQKTDKQVNFFIRISLWAKLRTIAEKRGPGVTMTTLYNEGCQMVVDKNKKLLESQP